ncbi:MAG: hypothetical protein LBT46_07090 [Planctomycetaceae bacterium]|nr:hypothetical protein [Planctomycetaceae bacterium]
MQSSLDFVARTLARPLLEQERCVHKIGFFPRSNEVRYKIHRSYTAEDSHGDAQTLPLRERSDFHHLWQFSHGKPLGT